jgi:hypothetical protein
MNFEFLADGGFISWAEAMWVSPWFRAFALLVGVAATIWVIAKVYSGDLQNAERGPVAIRRHAGNVSRNTLVVHRNLIPMTMDGVHARCTFMYVYDGYRGRREHVKLKAYDTTLSVSPTALRGLVDVARGNEVPDVGSEEVFWPVLDLENEQPERIEATPARAREYARQNRILERWVGDDSLSLISLHPDVMNEVREARDEFIQTRVEKLRATKTGNWLQRMNLGGWGRKRPGAVGNYYIKFQFSNDPVFVLTKHPDRDVRMTAWLTVLTSLFAMAMDVFPLMPDRGGGSAKPPVTVEIAAPPDAQLTTNSDR